MSPERRVRHGGTVRVAAAPPPPVTGRAGGPAARWPGAAALRAYPALTKPRIVELLLITTLPVMFLAAHGLPPWWPAVATLVGGAGCAGSANALNCYIDRDIDSRMRRTRHRPLAVPAASATVSPRGALIFGVVTGAASTCWLWLAVSWLSAALALVANLFYVLGYTLLLKRRTTQNIVWGGLAGCLPALIGWTAITGRLSWIPLPLFGVVFFWTPPHFWALAIRFKQDYAAADVPMLPVLASDWRVARSIIRYSWAMVACSLLLWPVARTGPLYPAAAVVLGTLFLAEAYQLAARARSAPGAPGAPATRVSATSPVSPVSRASGDGAAALRPMRLFHWSNTYLAFLFLSVAIDALVH